MKKSATILLMALAIGLSSCSTKEAAVSDLRNLRDDINNYGYQYTTEQWQKAADRYQKIETKINKYASEYTYEQSQEIGRLKGECISGFAKGVTENISNKANNLKGQIEGIIEGIKDAFNK